MQRTQISLTEQQARRLRRAAAERGVSMAHVIREAIDAYVVDDTVPRHHRIERALRAAGRFRSGRSDVSRRHDDHLAADPRGW